MSKIEVDAITQQSGTTLTVGGGACKTATVDATTVTLGRSGGTVSLAAGATQSGFGRTGTVDWQTGSIKTSTFTAANGEGYFANTSGGAFTMNLPAGTAGNIVSVVDYTNTFQTNALTVTPNGSQKIGGIAASFISNTEGQSLTWVYVDDTEGWKNVQDSTSNATANPFILATGGVITTSGNCKIHTFTGPGTFTVNKISCTGADNTVSYMVVAGGGGGGADYPACTGGGGAGAGGFREYKSPVTPYTASPLNGNPGGTAVTVTAQAYPITVGGGGAGKQGGPGQPVTPSNGNNSVFSTITSAAGGGGASNNNPISPPNRIGGPGGSGGGSTHYNRPAVGTGNTPPTSPAQGTNGGEGSPGPNAYMSGGGGGATVAGSPYNSGDGGGGNGATTSITGSPVVYSGGGGAGFYGPVGPRTAGQGGSGGGGNGGQPAPGSTAASDGSNGQDNTGGGGGGGTGTGGGSGSDGGSGGSGIVVIRYKYQ